MTIYFNHRAISKENENKKDYKYEIESLCRLFFPCRKIGISFENAHDYEQDAIIVYTKKLEKKTHLMVLVRFSSSRFFKYRAEVKNDVDQYQNECERNLCVGVYQLLTKIVGIAPKWGILTGIRPVKLINSYRKKGLTDNQITKILKDDFLVTPQKLQTAFCIADIQTELLSNQDPLAYSLYISIPFCPSKCSYCSFVSHSMDTVKKLIPQYIQKLCEELIITSQITKKIGLKLQTVYVGGGTPTSITAQELQAILNCVTTNFDMDTVKEFTVEAGRADTITKEKLEVIKNAGVKRISINPQTFSDEVLIEIGRKHTAQDVVDCFQLAREVGFDGINMDLIAGLPKDDLKTFQMSVDKAIALDPENITVHTLSIKRSSDLYPHEGLLPDLTKNQTNQMVEYSMDKLVEAGYFPYYLYRQKNTLENLENVGYSKPKHMGLYNVYIMDEVHTIIAVGAAGVTKLVDPFNLQILRVSNFKFPHDYLNRFDEMATRKEEVTKFYERILQI